MKRQRTEKEREWPILHSVSVSSNTYQNGCVTILYPAAQIKEDHHTRASQEMRRQRNFYLLLGNHRFLQLLSEAIWQEANQVVMNSVSGDTSRVSSWRIASHGFLFSLLGGLRL